jgi:hypothetical protein
MTVYCERKWFKEKAKIVGPGEIIILTNIMGLYVLESLNTVLYALSVNDDYVRFPTRRYRARRFQMLKLNNILSKMKIGIFI